jgi:hypothetical protein
MFVSFVEEVERACSTARRALAGLFLSFGGVCRPLYSLEEWCGLYHTLVGELAGLQRRLLPRGFARPYEVVGWKLICPVERRR